MPLRLYNTLTKKEEDFVPLKEGEVRMYTCGPTVYGRPHIGNYSSFLLADLLRRWLEVGHGMKVTHVKNITDVGHLAGDEVADAQGDDKIERQSREEKADPLELARKYAAQYIEDETALNFKEPEHRPLATETIPEMLTMIAALIERGHAYETDDGVYFDVTSFADYGKLSGNTLENLSSGARIKVDEKKKHPADFALWKKCVGENEHHILRWDSKWGEGFPGWHIECSCMSEKFLGSPFDIHTGGEDLIFPHHECEIAQSVGSRSGDSAISAGTEGAENGTNKTHVNYWVHKRFIDMGDVKMSKSLGNVLTLPDIEAMGFNPLDLRYYLLSVHYRTNLKFTKKGLEDAHKARRKIMEWMKEVEDAEVSEGVEEWDQKFSEAMNSDLNTPAALATVFDLMSWSRNENQLGACKGIVETIRSTFGCFDPEGIQEIPKEVAELAQKRLDARANKDFEASDSLRNQIQARGFEVKDTEKGQEIIKM
ncbi:MAG: cysteine--tRNA ligase [Candidatus Peribacteraceae bacterium]|jgi:cysteinyl-tRNA synthetase|nr:cysteine--tRNA ligase [bacterium]MDP6561649.1 cysteine--tRNA ligase [Candidatus Peribacteraceae bacterium]|tara:strand:- start:17818 stop:19266 length:1449 start_codon:yes stop_codon:yes gene_type:complete